MTQMQFRELRGWIVNQQEHRRILALAIFGEHHLGAGAEADVIGNSYVLCSGGTFQRDAECGDAQCITLRAAQEVFFWKVGSDWRQWRLVRSRLYHGQKLLQVLSGNLSRLVDLHDGVPS